MYSCTSTRSSQGKKREHISQDTFAVKRLIVRKEMNEAHLLRIIRQEIQILTYEPLRDAPTLVNVLGYEWPQNNPFPSLVIEFAPYGTIEDFLRIRGTRGSPHGWELCRKLCTDIAAAVEILHTHGIIHGDIRPQNVLVYWDRNNEWDATAKLSDFGHSNFSLDALGVRYMGTPLFCPPEIFSNFYNKDSFCLEDQAKCDVWAFGLTCWCIMTNRPTFFCDEWMPSAQREEQVDITTFLSTQDPGFLLGKALEVSNDVKKYPIMTSSVRDSFITLFSQCLEPDPLKRSFVKDVRHSLDFNKYILSHIDQDTLHSLTLDTMDMDGHDYQMYLWTLEGFHSFLYKFLMLVS